MLIFAANDIERLQLSLWAGERIPAVGDLGFGECQAAGVLRRGALAAAVIFHEWQPRARTLQLSMAADTPQWATRDVIRGLFRYAFCDAGAHKLWTAMPAANERAIRFNLGVGFKREATLRHHFGPGAHAVICSMLEREWRHSRWAR